MTLQAEMELKIDIKYLGYLCVLSESLQLQ